MGLFDRNVERDDQCKSTDREVRYLVEDFISGGLSDRLAFLLERAAEDRGLSTEGDTQVWIERLAHFCGLRSGVNLDTDWDS